MTIVMVELSEFFFWLLSLNTTANQLVAPEERGGGDDNGVITNKCVDKERHALLQFKANLHDPYGSLSRWRDDKDDCCQWRGVWCDSQTGHHVTGLDIPSAGLVGEISHSLVNLTYLNHLDLSYNSFHGTIPTFVGSLTRLTYLDLSNNSFYGTIPQEFGNLTNLQYLYLIDVGICRVENIEWLSHLSHLEELEMDGISLAKANQWVMYPNSSFLNSSSSISFLDVQNNNLNSSMHGWLFPLTSNKLRVLDLSGNMLDGIPKYLGNLCSLAFLNLNDNSAVVNFPDFLNNLSGCTSLALVGLHASHSQFTGSLPDDIHNFSSLSKLCLSDNHMNGTMTEKLWELPSLEKIDLSQNHLSGAISKNIGKSKATFINLSKNPLQGVPSTDHMSNLSYVEQLDLSSCKLGPHFPKWIQKLEILPVLTFPTLVFQTQFLQNFGACN
ncbi:unnamed protein product [Lactuca virosa]|uniref:Leucine-rich repeat-containing N-terminal plant-type domain-containing protein n=1 Tax=Lactuca virosa TaxID=75947 RepID=A0AAU9PR63_9ASTR|nr:unnamed protein product [Lactuca virosa]